MNLEISASVERKLLEKHDVTVSEVFEAFANRQMKFRKENRPEHLTVPTTRWFISETDAGRILKIAFVPGNPAKLKTACPIDE